MDGDDQYFRDHDESHFPSTLGMGRRAVIRPSAGTTDRFRQVGGLPSARGDTTTLAQATGGQQQMSAPYVDYGYTDTSFQRSTLQQGTSQLQPYSHEAFPPPQQSPAHPPPQHRQHLQPQSFNGYGQDVAYNLPEQGPTAHGPYDFVSQYSTRQPAAAIDALGQIAVSPYFTHSESTATPVVDMNSPYVNSHLHPYNHPGPIGSSSATVHPFAANMADLTTNPLAAEQQQQQQPRQHAAQPPSQPQPVPPPPPSQPSQPSQHPPQQSVPAESSTATSDLDEAYAQFQRALRGTFDNTRAGRLVEASRSLLEISGWLIANARQLGLLREDQTLYPDQLHLWKEFNLAWLSLFQMQKDLLLNALHTGQRHNQRQPHGISLVGAEYLEHMGGELVGFCDQMEQHGLVDYQMGVWEEEILCVLGQCLDLMESRPDLLHVQLATATATAAMTTRS